MPHDDGMLPVHLLLAVLLGLAISSHTELARAQEVDSPAAPAVGPVSPVTGPVSENVPATAPKASAGSAPQPSISTAARVSPRARLTLLSERSDLTVYKTRDRVYGTKLCSPECSREIDPGHYAFGLRVGTRAPIWNGRVFEIKRDQTLFVHYQSHRASRIAGAILLPTSLLIGILYGSVLPGLQALSAHSEGREQTLGDRAEVAILRMLCAGTAVVSIWLMTRRDRAHVETREEHTRRKTSTQVVENTMHLRADAELSRRALACAPPEDRRLEIRVEVDAAHGISSLLAPSSFGRGGRRCLKVALHGQTLPLAPAGSWVLVLDR